MNRFAKDVDQVEMKMVNVMVKIMVMLKVMVKTCTRERCMHILPHAHASAVPGIFTHTPASSFDHVSCYALPLHVPLVSRSDNTHMQSTNRRVMLCRVFSLSLSFPCSSSFTQVDTLLPDFFMQLLVTTLVNRSDIASHAF